MNMTIDYDAFRKEIYKRCDEILDQLSGLTYLSDKSIILTREIGNLSSELKEKYNLACLPITELDPVHVYEGSYNINFISEAEFEQWKRQS